MKVSPTTFLPLVAGFLLFGCVTQNKLPPTGDLLIAPGILDLPVLPGSFIPDDCAYETYYVPKSHLVGCIAYPLEHAKDDEVGFDWKYVHELEESGWSFEGGAANVFFMERPIEGKECKESLALVYWLFGDKTEIAKYGTSAEREVDWTKIPFGVIWFVLETDSNCND